MLESKCVALGARGTNSDSLLQGTPGVNIADAISPSFKKIMPYQIMIAFIGKHPKFEDGN